MVKYLLIFGFIFIIGCNDTQEVKRPSKQTYVSPQLITRASSEKGMSENLLAPGLMLLETSLNPSTTIKPEVSIVERKSKTPCPKQVKMVKLFIFRVVPKEVGEKLRHFDQN